MLSPKMQEALNQQLNAELFSAYLYLSMSAWCEARDFPGMANWMRVQAQEELGHVMRFYNFIVDRDGRVLLKPVGGPKTDWDSPVGAFDEAHKHEQKVTELINNLVKLAIEEKDFAVHTFLQWFINEQVEEEASVWRIVQKLRLAGDNGAALLIMDNELGQRTVGAAAATPA